MTVVAFRMAEPRPVRLVEVFCVQAYWRDRGEWAEGRFQQFASREAALRAGKGASVKAAGVLVYVMRGYPGTDTWNEPCPIARFGGLKDERDKARELMFRKARGCC